MKIDRVIVENFKCLRHVDMTLNDSLNIVVGDNEVGKTSLLEAIHLALSGRFSGRSVFSDLSPYLMNQRAWREYLSDLSKLPPEILIEVYLSNTPDLARLRGTNNSQGEDVPGLAMRISLDEQYGGQFKEYCQAADVSSAMPIEYFAVGWRSFSDDPMDPRAVPTKSTFVDGSIASPTSAANRHILRIVDDELSADERVALSLTYRGLKHQFLEDERVVKVNRRLGVGREVSDKQLSLSMDLSSRGAWEAGIAAHVDDIPFVYAGKGEQGSIGIALAMDSADERHLFLIEEPENHLSHSRMARLVDRLRSKAGDRQVIISTHSSFVLNKMGLGGIILFRGDRATRLTNLEPDTIDYFKKLSGYDTLRVILSERCILVEGPSDELIVQKAHIARHSKTPLERGIDVVSVGGLAFPRFLELAKPLGIQLAVVTDNDTSVERLRRKYQEYGDLEEIPVYYDEDEGSRSLEEQFLKVNSVEVLNRVLKQSEKSREELLSFMKADKPRWALRVFDSDETALVFPKYIQNAVE